MGCAQRSGGCPDAARGGGRGDRPPAFEQFFDEQYTRVLTVCASLLGTDAAEDVAQEAFIRALLRWDTVAAMQRPDAWVRRVALNLATSRLRRVASEARALARLGRRRAPATDAADVESQFWDAVRRLPTRQAQAVALHYADDLGVADVALVMGCAEGTVKAHLHAARATLADRLQVER